MGNSNDKGRLTRAWGPYWAEPVDTWPLNEELDIPINKAVQDVVGNSYLCAHSDLTEYLWRIEKQIEDESVRKFCPAVKAYSYELRYAAAVLFSPLCLASLHYLFALQQANKRRPRRTGPRTMISSVTIGYGSMPGIPIKT